MILGAVASKDERRVEAVAKRRAENFRCMPLKGLNFHCLYSHPDDPEFQGISLTEYGTGIRVHGNEKTHTALVAVMERQMTPEGPDVGDNEGDHDKLGDEGTMFISCMKYCLCVWFSVVL